MKFPLGKIVRLLIIATIVSFLASYVYANSHDFKQILLANPEQILLLMFIALITATLNGIIIKYLVEPFNIRLHVKEWFGLATITTFYNTIMPFRTGFFTKAAYLRERHSFSFTNLLAMMAGIYVINFFIVGMLGLASLAVMHFKYGISNVLVTCFFVGVALSTSAILIFPPKLAETKREFVNKFIRVVNGWHLIKNNRRVLAVSSIVTLAQLLLSAYATTISFRVTHLDIDLYGAVFITCVGAVSVLIGITPANLGITEGLAVMTGWILGITSAQSLNAALIRRLASTVIIFILGPIFSYLLLKHKPGGDA